jgi:hypothetical protein
MRGTIEIEDIEQRRLSEGIDDVELRREVRALQVGDVVLLTSLTPTGSFETLPVRITSIRGAAFRGKLAGSPASAGLSRLRLGSLVTFTASHVHSLPHQRPSHEP